MSRSRRTPPALLLAALSALALSTLTGPGADAPGPVAAHSWSVVPAAHSWSVVPAAHSWSVAPARAHSWARPDVVRVL